MSVQLDSKGNPMEIGKYYKLDYFSNAKYLGPSTKNNRLARFRLLDNRKIGYSYNNSPPPILDKTNENNDTDSEDESDNDFSDSDSDDDMGGGTRKKKKTNKNKRRKTIKRRKTNKKKKKKRKTNKKRK